MALLYPGLSPLQAAAAPARQAAIDASVRTLEPKLIETRRDLHMHPELSNREERTARLVADRLRTLGLADIRTGVAHHGVTALLQGARPGPVIAVRADMDALPIQETIDVPYKSKNPGVKHACGHDVHTAVQLGVAEVLAGMRATIPGTIKFIFQPAEEGPPPPEEGGARLMIKQGVLDNPAPRAIFGLHCNPALEAGSIGYSFGPMLASTDRFKLSIRGKMSHGAWPHEGIDSIVVAAEAIVALQTIASRRIDPLEPIVVTIGKIQGGNRFNIIAPQVDMEGTMRTHDEGVRTRAKEHVRAILEGVTAAHGASFDLKYVESNDVTYNLPALAEETLPAVRAVVGDDRLIATRPVMGGEDFSAYQKVIPGFFYWLGVGNKERGITAALHTPDFDVDERCLAVGVRVMANILLDHLERHAASR